ncbi:TetR family transcriptional regulator [Streptomonospora sp. S1-112]|uniref:TetR family transcriptional regulator n=1 Tax=Streptomonospora mangrovi TaxID=2883123 RepID=A0A9X3NS95_9ACTN|nr:TetR family transcriptional regulator [Streptomonospora mangrovi]MDA0565880.1 TetR family transcriptional regulator [Streptomonospora mangrovi]
MIRDAEATRARLLAAARREFAAYGIAGARVDRIAAEANSNKAQIYHYFGNKDGLFDAVFTGIVEQVVTGIPLDVDDLPGYAVKLARGYDEHPDILRLSTWHRLERGDSALVEAAVRSNQTKVDQIAAAQREGRLTTHYPPGVLLALVLHTAAVWASTPDELAGVIGPTSPETRHRLVHDAVRALLSA